jgi:hypothetical protein
LLGEIRGADHAALAGMVSRAWDRGLGPYAAGGTEGRWNRSPGDREELRELCGCLGGRALAAVLELFARGLAREGGMPDLVLWRRRRSEGESEGDGGAGDKEEDRKPSSSSSSNTDPFGEAMVVEVKGPRDRLSVRFLFLVWEKQRMKSARERKGLKKTTKGRKTHTLNFLFFPGKIIIIITGQPARLARCLRGPVRHRG